MGEVHTGASMSLDGYIAGPGETGFEHLFGWMGNGEAVVATTHPELTLRMSEVSARIYRQRMADTGAIVVGRKLFDATGGWGGNHPMGVPVVVLSHRVPEGWPREDAPFHFVSDGIESAVAKAQELAGGKTVGVNGGTIARQCLHAGLLDEIWIDLVPVLLGGGTPFFDQLRDAPYPFAGPTSVIAGDGVTHLRYRVRR